MSALNTYNRGFSKYSKLLSPSHLHSLSALPHFIYDALLHKLLLSVSVKESGKTDIESRGSLYQILLPFINVYFIYKNDFNAILLKITM